MSSIDSSPTDNRTMSDVTPAAFCCSASSCRWVVEAGWMTSERASPTLARCEIAAFGYRVLHVAARITRTARQTRLRIDKTWRWATAIATGWGRLRTAFG